IQGASNVAKAGLDALKVLSKGKYSTKRQFLRDFEETSHYLVQQRPTEPALRNAINYVDTVVKKQVKGLKTSQEALLRATNKYFEDVERAHDLIAEYGAAHLPKNAVILTHCHSSTANHVLRLAQATGKNPTVLVTETRPLYQGKTTARELAALGIPVKYIVDSAASNYLRDVDAYLVGADAVTAEGDVVNKIGTALLAEVCWHRNIPVYVATSTFKFDALTLKGPNEPIEYRDPTEIAKFKEENIQVLNPAFDVTDAKYVDAIISELGVLPPQSFVTMMAWDKRTKV
ncbi:MAG: S-methyl-5-thioribose-1-phosphate isomerase, partial [Candidatus Diapherotrites archaeon]|nr:S-methyl-5-thioribose-1-phosphate isomerase [Candidatus Diapherotrites archaeon]